MVLRTYSRAENNARLLSGLFKAGLAAILCLPLAGCGQTDAKQVRPDPVCQRPELRISDAQINYITNSLQKWFRWDAYWTYDDDGPLSSYNQKVGQVVPITTIALKGGIVVLVPTMENAIFAFYRRPDDHLSSPQFLRTTIAIGESSKGTTLLSIAKAFGDWRTFIEFSQGGTFDYQLYRDRLAVPEAVKRRIDVNKNAIHLPVTLSEDEIKKYIDLNRESLPYCEAESSVSLLPIDAFTYDPLTDRKLTLLSEIEKESVQLAERMFGKRGSAIITIPNFNLNDAHILVLLEHQDGEAYTLELALDEDNVGPPVEYSGTFEIRNRPKYGTASSVEAKVKRQALKVLKYKL